MREVYIFGSIGDIWLGGVTAKNVIEQLKDVGEDDVTVHINSGGGDVFEATAIQAALSRVRGHVTMSVEGLAASAASVIACSGDETVMARGSMLMVHNPWTWASGSSQELRDVADRLDKTRDGIANTYVAKTGKDVADVLAMLDAETWMDADEALDEGFVDRIDETVRAVAMATPNEAMAYSRAPECLEVREPAAAGRVKCEPLARIKESNEYCAGNASVGSAKAASGSRARLQMLGGNVYKF